MVARLFEVMVERIATFLVRRFRRCSHCATVATCSALTASI